MLKSVSKVKNILQHRFFSASKSQGEVIKKNPKGGFFVPNHPIIPFIAGDGIGSEITPVMQKVVDYAVYKAYDGSKKISWMEIYAGDKATQLDSSHNPLPEETITALKKYRISIKGPLGTPTGGGIRSLNVTMRQILDLYICLRPVQYFMGTPTPLKEPEKINMVIFRENSEDIYAGIEWKADTDDGKKVVRFLQEEMGVKKIRFPEHCGIGIKPVSKEGTERLVKAAIQYAIDQNKSSVTLVHKGNIMKFTEGAFRDWGYQIARTEFGATEYEGGPWLVLKNPRNNQNIVIKDVIADAFLQQILLQPENYSVIATLNLNGDYISDALAAQVGGLGIAPGANINNKYAIFEATHGTAPQIVGKNIANPSSIILSAEMMLRHLGWNYAADNILWGIQGAIKAKKVTFDFAKFMDNVTPLSTYDFGEAVIEHIESSPGIGLR